jgi:predicted  nucleic acid-binding Zn-ribbon protein
LSIPDQIRSLEKLAALDAELKTLEDQLSQERSTLNGLKANLKKLDEKLDADRALLASAEKTRNEFITDVRNMNVQLDQSREKLSRSRNEREANAAQRELEELRKLIRDREEEVGKLTADTDAVRQQIEATDGERKKLADELASREGDISASLGSAESSRAAKRAEREVAVKALPPQLYRRYDMIRQKKGVGIAQTTDGTCKACNIALPPQLFHRLRREPMLEQCPSCFRIIYFVPPQAAATAAAAEKA